MRILITNDDSYRAQGISELVEMMRPFGEIMVVAPKIHQSGMSMAVDLGYKPIAVKKVWDYPGVSWWYVDGSPATCVKFAVGMLCGEHKPDVVISGINHGSNAASAMLYSATVGAAQEAALCGIPSFAISIDDTARKTDFSSVKAYLPELFESLIKAQKIKFGTFYNINFPAIEPKDVKGVKVCHQGINHWEKEFEIYDPKVFERIGLQPQDTGVRYFPEVEDGENVYMMKGTVIDNENNPETPDHRYLDAGWITVVPHNIDMTDYAEYERLCNLGLNKNFK